MYITKGNCEHLVSALRLSHPSSLMYRVGPTNAVRDAAVRKCDRSARA